MDRSIETIQRAVVRGIDLAASALADGMRKADEGSIPLESYTALLKKAEDLVIQATRLNAITQQALLKESPNAISEPA